MGFTVAPFATADGLDAVRDTAVAVDPSTATTRSAGGSGVARDSHLEGEGGAALPDRDAELLASGVLAEDLPAHRAMQTGVDLFVSCELHLMVSTDVPPQPTTLPFNDEVRAQSTQLCKQHETLYSWEILHYYTPPTKAIA